MSTKVSVIIPSRGERFLVPTIKDVLSKARGDIEVIAVLDGGPWPHAHEFPQQLPDDPRLVVLRHNEPAGMRQAINRAAAVARGTFLLKTDGHCSFSEGFDEVLKADCDRDWIVVPRRDRLDPIAWTRQEVGKPPIDAHYLSNPLERPGDPSCGLHGTVWNARAAARADVLLDEEMSSQGSCWFMHREYFDRRIGPLDIESYGSFIQEFQEVGLKCWLSGGRVMVNKRAQYLHLHKGRTYGRGYFLSRDEQMRGVEYAARFWMTDQWPDRTHDLRWLIERFSPVPTWPNDLDAVFRQARDVYRVPAGPASVAVAPAIVATPSLVAAAVRAAAPAPAAPVDAWGPTHNGQAKHAPAAFVDRVHRGFKRRDLARLFADRGYTRGAEVGVADGRFSEVLCQSIAGVELLCVDPWLKYSDNPRGGDQAQQDGNYVLATARLAPYRASLVRAFSMDAVRDVPLASLDFVYIDGHHSFDFVMQDLIEWSKRVRPGGCVAGHDFYHFKWAGVVEAVAAYTAAHGIADWSLCDEREPSFWWVRP